MALAGRFEGSFSSRRSTSASSPGGQSGRCQLGATGGVFRCWPMIATATLIVGIVREAMSWPSYALDRLDRLPIPTVAGVVPGKHTTRKGWLTKDFQYRHSPYTSDVDAPLFTARDGRTLSVRQIAREVAWYFRHSIRRHSDPFSFRLLFALLDGRLRSMLELPDRPEAYEDVGASCRWGRVLPDLARPREAAAAAATIASEPVADLRRYVAARRRARVRPPRPEKKAAEVVVPPVPVPAWDSR